MKSKNRYYSRSKITEAKFRQIIRFFAMDFTATDTAVLTNISLRSINSIFIKIRKKIATECENISPFTGVVELDESYFGARRIRGNRGRVASGKTIVFGLLKREGNVYTEVTLAEWFRVQRSTRPNHSTTHSVRGTRKPTN